MDEEEQFLQEQMLRLIICLDQYLGHDLGEYHDVDWDLDDDQMTGFTALSGAILQLANIILADGKACERWMDELRCKSVPELFCSSCLDRAPVLQLGAD